MPWLLRTTPFDPARNGEVTLYLSDVGFVTEPADTPANIYWQRRIRTALDLSRSLFAQGDVGGMSAISAGSAVIDNGDGGLDAWDLYDWDGRRVDIWFTAVERPRLADFMLIWSGTAERFVPGETEVRIELRDLSLLLDRSYQSARFAGTGGAEGHAGLKDQRKPRALGRPRQIEPVLISNSPIVYGYGDGPCGGVLAAYDRGDLFTVVGPDYATYAAMAAASVTGVDYVTCNALGLIRFAAQPKGPLTLDVEGRKPAGGGSAPLTFADMTALVLPLDIGMTVADFAPGTVAAMNSICPQVLGHWYDGTSEVLVGAVIDELAEAVGAFWGFNADRKLVLGRFDVPKAVADHAFDLRNILSIQPMDTARRLATQSIGYGRRWRPLSDNDIAGSVTTGREALGQEWRVESYTGSAVVAQSLLARTERVDTALQSQTDAAAEAARRVALHGPKRRSFQVRVPFTPGLDAGDTVALTYDRYGLEAGQRFVVMEASRDAAAEENLLTLWG